MTPEARHIHFTNGFTRSYSKNKVDWYTWIAFKVIFISLRKGTQTAHSYCKPSLEELGSLGWHAAEMTHSTVWICAWFLAVCMFWVKTGETALDQARENDNPEVALLLTKAPQVRKHTHTEEQLKWQEKAVDFFFSLIFLLFAQQQKNNNILILFSSSFKWDILGMNTLWIALAQWLVAHVHVLHESNVGIPMHSLILCQRMISIQI